MKKYIKPMLYNSKNCIQDKDPLLCLDDLNHESLLSIWMKYYGSDPRIALGRYSPLEKEIMRLGGVHTIATRRLLAQKEREEEKMLKELRQKSPDYQKAMEYKKEHPLLNTGKKSMEKTWTARIIIPREELKVPTREKKTINKHIERMELGRGLQDWAHYKQFQSSSFLPAVTPDSKPANQERDEDEETSKANKTEIKMNVIFKADEPKKTIISNPNDRQTFDVRTKLERNLAGHTNRTRFLPTDFPGDLLFLNQNYKSTRIHLSHNMKLFLSNKEGHWKSCFQYP
ncbi:uncharacterized protein C10orf120 homolog [Phascolarctos cinereus]|uniref:Uncharacterized protein C10orf120 homolog n=1 Tax=Phascolarctos cinereus TaxID=38626 RepID=A0A6P5ILT5_PHACI|nr:uncharacterized protein C10orf120 homolog [Phascolarctos cinereus]